MKFIKYWLNQVALTIELIKIMRRDWKRDPAKLLREMQQLADETKRKEKQNGNAILNITERQQ